MRYDRARCNKCVK